MIMFMRSTRLLLVLHQNHHSRVNLVSGHSLTHTTPLQKYDPSVIMHNLKTFDIRKVPCARDAFLHAIGGGLAIGAIRFVRSRFIRSSIDYAIGSFLLIGVVDLYVMYAICPYNRQHTHSHWS